jgi:uncharacterized protein (TIGR03437 family)
MDICLHRFCLLAACLAGLAPAFGQFAPSPNSPFFSGHNPTAIVSADFNGDKIPDLAVANQSDNTVTILLGDGKGNFAATQLGPSANGTFPTGANPSAITSADFNGDGNMDLAVANVSDNTVTILLGNGTGGFSSAGTVATGNGPTAIATADFNSDMKADLAVANIDSGTVTILLGDGTGGFTSPPLTLIAGKFPVAILAIDLNANGIPDLAVVNSGDGTVLVFEDPYVNPMQMPVELTSVVVPTVLPITQSVSAVTAANFSGHPLNSTGAAYLDLAVTYYDNATFKGNLLLFVSDESGGYDSPPAAYFPMPFGSQPVAIGTGSFALGGEPGIAIANYRSDTLAVFAGDGMGDFTAASNSPFATGSLPRALTVADFNGDGLADVAVANYYDGSVTVLLNTFASVPTMLSAASSAATVAPSSLVSIYGTGFGSAVTAPSTSVSMTDGSGLVLSMKLLFTSPTQINALVPAAAATGTGSFTVTTSQGKPQKAPVMITAVAPALFSANESGKGPALGYVTNLPVGSGMTPVFTCTSPTVCSLSPFDVSSGQVSLILYGTGIRNRAQLSSVTVMVGTVAVPVFYAGSAATALGVGLDEIEVALPATLLHAGTVYVQVSIGGTASNQVTIEIE